MSSEKRRHAILVRLERTGTNDADALVVAAAAGSALGALLSELEPLIGEQGVRALYQRSIQLSKAHFPWLTSTDLLGATSMPVADLRARLDGRSAEESRAVSAALLATLTDVLALLLGEALTHRILLAAWQAPGSDEVSLESKL